MVFLKLFAGSDWNLSTPPAVLCGLLAAFGHIYYLYFMLVLQPISEFRQILQNLCWLAIPASQSNE